MSTFCWKRCAAILISICGDDRALIAAIQPALAPAREVRRRSWGDVVNIELRYKTQRVFSFQIAQRTAQLQPSIPLPWADSLPDSFDDLIAAKMVAVIERGAPRDFRDIYAVCSARLTTPERCWHLWRLRQALAGNDTDAARARLALQIHLERIALHRPLAEIEDRDQRAHAEQLRGWFSEIFIHASLV